KAGQSNDIYYASFDGTRWTGDIRIDINGINPKTSSSPSSVVFNNKLYIVYKAGQSNDIYYASFDGTRWTGDIRIDINGINPKTSSSPSSVVFNSKLYIVYKAGQSNDIYYASFDGTRWTGDKKIYGIRTNDSPNISFYLADFYFYETKLLKLKATPSTIAFCSDSNYPFLNHDDSHIQGIQQFYTGNKKYFVISSSNYNKNETDFKGLLIFISEESKSVIKTIEINEYGHAGGIQVHGNTLLVPLAKKATPGVTKKQLSFYDITDLANPTLRAEVNLNNFNDAQAAGFTPTNPKLVFVIESDMTIKYAWLSDRYTLIGNWRNLTINKALWSQNINLFYNKRLHKYWLIGLRKRNNSKTDVLDLFEVKSDNFANISPGNTLYLDFKGSSYLYGGNMRNAGGVHFSDRDIVSISSFGRDIFKNCNNKIFIYS
nr:hypothetical protein [Prochloraceae cyanobacterium]